MNKLVLTGLLAAGTMTHLCERAGVQIVHTSAKAILTRDGAVCGVKTDEGTIACPCCGRWSRFEVTDSAFDIPEHQAEQTNGMEMT